MRTAWVRIFHTDISTRLVILRAYLKLCRLMIIVGFCRQFQVLKSFESGDLLFVDRVQSLSAILFTGC
jgi:hypothetical protein